MLTVLGFTIGFVITAGVFLAITMRHDRAIWQERQQVMTQFQGILEQRLEKHQPRIVVWLTKNDVWNQPHALMEVNGHFYSTRSSSDAADMQAKADEAAEYFDRKQLMKWVFDD